MAGGSNRNGTTPAADGFSLISNARLIALYRSMLEFRLLVRAVRELVPHSAVSLSAVRSVAALAGACGDLRRRDALEAPMLGALSGLFTGDPLEHIVQNLLAPDHSAPASPLVAALRRKPKSGSIVVAIAAVASQPAAWTQAFASADLRKLPIVFIRLHNAELKSHASSAPASIPSITVDIHDVVAVYRVAFEAIARARRGSTPTLIECVPYRPSRAGSHRPASANPIRAMESYLRGKGLYTPSLRHEIVDDLKHRVSAAISAARAMQPSPGSSPSE